MQCCVRRWWWHWVGALALAGMGLPAAALTWGQQDGFDGGSLGGWGAGVASLNPPVVLPGGGPGGADDAYLQISALGGLGPGSRLTVIAGPQWAGDYISAGVDRITLQLRNLGSSDLQLRLLLEAGPGLTALSTTPVLLPAGGGWVAAAFDLSPAALSGPAATVLTGVTQLRLFHASSTLFPGEPIVATLGVDAVSAVPEPAAAWLLLSGSSWLLLRRRAWPFCRRTT
jgi:hypothetical protein